MKSVDIEQLKELFSIIESLVEAISSNQLLQRIADGAASGADANGAWIWNLNEDSTWAPVAMTEGSDTFEECNRPLELLGPGAEKVLEGGVIVIDDFPSWAFEHREEFEKNPLLPKDYFNKLEDARCSAAVVPLVEFDKVIGLLAVFRWDPPRTFVKSDVDLLLMYAAIASMALLRAKAYVSLSQTKEELESKVAKRTQDLARTTELLKRALHSNMQIQEKERQRIADDLHDRSCQLIAASLFDLQSAQAGLDNGDINKAKQNLASAKKLIRDVDKENRRLIEGVRPSVLSNKGLAVALQRRANELSQRYGGTWTFSVTGTLDNLGASEELVAFQLANEAMMNAAKHAQAQHVRVDIQSGEDDFTIDVVDDGVGFDSCHILEVALQEGSGHFGLATMKERVESFGGTLEITSGVDQGTAMHISFRIFQSKKVVLP